MMRNSILLLCLLMLPLSTALAAGYHRGMWVGMEIGGGDLTTEVNGVENDESVGYMGLKALFPADSKTLIGFEFSNWNIESNDAFNLQSNNLIKQTLFITQYYPAYNSGFFLKAGAGYAYHRNNTPGAERKKGWGATLGIGHDFVMEPGWSLTPFALYNVADTDDERHSMWAVGFGFAVGYY